MVHGATKSFLKAKMGHFLTISNGKLSLEDVQHPRKNDARLMRVQRRGERAQCLFYVKQENYFYISKVKSHERKVVMEKFLRIDFDSLDDSFWFEKVPDQWNEFCNMRSVSDPEFCLCRKGRRGVSISSQESLLLKEINIDKLQP